MLQVMVSLFNKAHSRVGVNNGLSESIDSIFGVLRGGMISPKLLTNFLTHNYQPISRCRLWY